MTRKPPAAEKIDFAALADQIYWQEIMEKGAVRDKRKVITICGSTRFIDIIAVSARILEREEKAIVLCVALAPQWYPEFPAPTPDMEWLQLDKITIADEVFFVNKNNHIGDSGVNEITHAKKLGKRIRYYTDDPIGAKVESILSQAIKPKTKPKK